MPILREDELSIFSHSAEQTRRLGYRLGKLLQAGDVICLSGDMGAGKTVFSSGIGQGWGAAETVTSPTYTLVHQHRRTQDETKLYHLDCYRLSGVADVDSIGFDDILEDKGVTLIEWAERIEEALPANLLWIDLRVVEETRRQLMLEAQGTRYQALLDDYRVATFGA